MPESCKVKSELSKKWQKEQSREQREKEKLILLKEYSMRE